MRNVTLFFKNLGGRNLMCSLLLIFSFCLTGQECLYEQLNQTFETITPGSRSICDDVTGLPRAYEIPVAIHVIRDNFEDIDFPTDFELNFMIKEVNKKLKPYFTLIPVLNPTDCESISFRPTERHDNITESNQLQIKNLSRIDPNTVCNIWIVNEVDGGASKGFAYNGRATNLDPNLDGIVITKGQIMDETLIHEFGHYLGLEHVWGRNEGNEEMNCHDTDESCTHGDFVHDTPRCLWWWFWSATDCSYSNHENLDPAPWCTYGDPIPCDNYMNYGTSRNVLTVGQIDRMIYTLVNYRPNLGAYTNTCIPCPDPCQPCYYGSPYEDPNNPPAEDFCSPCHPAHNHVTNYAISTAVSFTSPMLATNNITINAGGHLKVHTDLFMKTGTKIIVNSGGTLEIIGGHVTACDNEWDGIYMCGGNVIIRNYGIVTKAFIGVWSINPTIGNLTCDQAHFYDNRNGVALFGTKIVANFKNTTFDGMEHGVYLYHISGSTKFTDCTFSYQTNNGITAYSSQIEVQNNNKFIGCDNGVAVHNTFATGTSTEALIGTAFGLANTFTNCNKGIYSNDGRLNIRNNYVDNNIFGIYYSGQNGFKSYNNTFSGDSYAEGIYSTGISANQSYGNQYSSHVGIFPAQQNDNYTFYNNCFNTLWWDVNVQNDSQISPAQGSEDYAASNCFTKNGVGDFICYSPIPTIYAVPLSTDAPRCMTPETPGNYTNLPVSNHYGGGCAGAAGLLGTSEYDYIDKEGCKEEKLFAIMNVLKQLIQTQINILSSQPNNKNAKYRLERAKRHLRYVQHAWAWCLRKDGGRRVELKAWYATLSTLYPNELYYRIKASEVSAEDGDYALAKSELTALRAEFPAKADIINAIILTVDINEAIAAVPQFAPTFSNGIHIASEIYTLSALELQLLRTVAVNHDPLAVYGRVLLTFMTGERLEPPVNYPVQPRSIQSKSVSELKEIVTVYPNPAQNYIKLDIQNFKVDSRYQYEVVSMMGQKILHGTASETNAIQTTDLPDGIYIINLSKNDEQLDVRRIIIQK